DAALSGRRGRQVGGDRLTRPHEQATRRDTEEHSLAERLGVGRGERDSLSAKRMLLVGQNNDTRCGDRTIDALASRNLDLGQEGVVAAGLEDRLAALHRLPGLSHDLEDLAPTVES